DRSRARAPPRLAASGRGEALTWARRPLKLSGSARRTRGTGGRSRSSILRACPSPMASSSPASARAAAASGPSSPVWRVASRRTGRTLEVLDLARLSVADGEFVTVVGPSGCGKSTLLHILGGFIPANTGEIRVHGREVVGPGPDRGMVFQEFSLFPWRTVGGN